MMRAAIAVFLATVFSLGMLHGQEAEKPKYSGKFDANGRRLEDRLRSIAARDSEPAEIERQCKAISGWVNQVKTARSFKYRVQAAAALRSIANQDHRRAQLTSDETAELRKVCLDLSTAKEDEVRKQIVYALAVVADKSCAARFNELINDPVPEIHFGAFSALKAIGDESSVKPLQKYLTSNHNSSELESAVEALTAIGSPAARKVLEDLYKNADREFLKEAAAEGLDALDSKK